MLPRRPLARGGHSSPQRPAGEDGRKAKCCGDPNQPSPPEPRGPRGRIEPRVSRDPLLVPVRDAGPGRNWPLGGPLPAEAAAPTGPRRRPSATGSPVAQAVLAWSGPPQPSGSSLPDAYPCWSTALVAVVNGGTSPARCAAGTSHWHPWLVDPPAPGPGTSGRMNLCNHSLPS